MLKSLDIGFFGVCTFAGFVVMIGTAGASDCNSIDFNRIIIQSIIASVLMLVGFIGLKLSNRECIV